uniref:Uncharacterized protein n=1 Tax=Zonotrichia albicollis TaxID=44394 RepID=A0A8D2MKM2_ZONAL
MSFPENCSKAEFYALLAKYNATPSLGGEEWASCNWFNLENVIDRISSLQHESKFKLGTNKTILCSVLAACLTAAIETRFKRKGEENAIIDSLQNLAEVFQKQSDEERNVNNLLRATLREEHVKNSQNSDSSKETEEKETLRINQNCSQTELALMKNCGKHCCNNMKPLIKTECNYINNEDLNLHIITKEIPYTATELTKLAKQYGLFPQKSETEHICQVSLTGGDQILLSEKEAGGCWGHGVFLTTADRRIPWSPNQHTVHWAGGLNPLERRDPLISTPDELLENIHKAGCLQLIHENKLIPGFESPIQSPVKPEIMTFLTQELPGTLKPTAILQKTIVAMSSTERSDKLLSNQNDPFVFLYDLLRKRIKWDWTSSQEEAFPHCFLDCFSSPVSVTISNLLRTGTREHRRFGGSSWPSTGGTENRATTPERDLLIFSSFSERCHQVLFILCGGGYWASQISRFFPPLSKEFFPVPVGRRGHVGFAFWRGSPLQIL